MNTSQNKDEIFIPGKTYIPVAKHIYSDEDKQLMINVINDGKLTTGEQTTAFSKAFGLKVKVPNIITSNSGSSAILLAITALLNRCSTPWTVVTCATGFPTVMNPILQNGGNVLLVDADKETLNPCMWQLMSAIAKPEVGGVIISHTLGFPFDEELVARQCTQYGKWFVSDCADALGAQIHGKPVGYFADASTYSFYPAHHLSTGEGGAVATHDDGLAHDIFSYGHWGKDCWCNPGHDNTCGNRFTQQFGEMPIGYDHKYIHTKVGYNLKMTDIQAACGISQLKRLDGMVSQRQKNFRYLLNNLVSLEHSIMFIKELADTVSSPFGFPITIRENRQFSRRRATAFLEGKGIGTRPLFAGNLARQPAYLNNQHIDKISVLDDSDFLMNNTFWIGCHPHMTKEMLDYVVENVYNYFVYGDK
jgi:CDP-6-deoxy-D-xylo-4-hexulose-3-dehydrase